MSMFNFPISRDELIAITKQDYSKLWESQIVKDIENQSNIIANEIIKAALNGKRTLTYCKDKGFEPISIFKFHQIVKKIAYCDSDYPTKNILNEIIESLKLKFPGVNIITDPLQTYIHISWE